MELDPHQLRVVNSMTDPEIVTTYVIGPGGYGKTAAIREGINKIRRENPDAKFSVTAMTSVAADVIGVIAGNRATTLHSWWGIGSDSLRMHDETYMRATLAARQPQNPLDTDFLLIDEASMLTVQVLDVMDRVLRDYRKQPNVRFGGLKVILVGDPMQLPPVAPTPGPGTQRDQRLDVTSCLCHFDDHRRTEYVILREAHRCSDLNFQRMLRNLISQDVGVRRSAMGEFNRFHVPGYELHTDMIRRAMEMGAMIISHLNETVDRCNQSVREYLRSSGHVEYEIPMPTRLFTDADIVSIPTDEGLDVEEEVKREQQEIVKDRKRYFLDGTIYEGMLVQIRANHTSKNDIPVRVGDICTFKGKDESGNAILVRKKDNQELVIGQHESKSEYWQELKWTGYPFISANASTVHLVQGCTITTPLIFHSNIRGNIHGQLPFYLNVAASRVTNPENFIITHKMPRDALDSLDITRNLASRWELQFMADYPR
jgi:hypothetical protein